MKIKIAFLPVFLLEHVSEKTSSSLNHSIQYPLPLPDTVPYRVQ